MSKVTKDGETNDFEDFGYDIKNNKDGIREEYQNIRKRTTQLVTVHKVSTISPKPNLILLIY